jgi:uncharacterized protein with PQ loop repeat
VYVVYFVILYGATVAFVFAFNVHPYLKRSWQVRESALIAVSSFIMIITMYIAVYMIRAYIENQIRLYNRRRAEIQRKRQAEETEAAATGDNSVDSVNSSMMPTHANDAISELFGIDLDEFLTAGTESVLGGGEMGMGFLGFS